jgi:cobaltochelatase CobN
VPPWLRANAHRALSDVLVLLTTADTEILAAAHATRALPEDFGGVRCANPATDPDLDLLLDGARIVVGRLLGGRRAWPEGVAELRARSERDGFPLLLLGGEAEPDAELAELSTAPAGVVAQAFEYLRHGGVENTEQLLRFLSDALLLTGHGFEPPRELDELGVYVPGRGDVTIEEAVSGFDGTLPTVGIAFYRSHRVTGNTAFVDALASAVQAAGANVLCVWAYSLRPDVTGRVPVLELLDGRIDALITTMLASGGANASDLDGGWQAEALAALDVPVIQSIQATTSRAAWDESDSGLTPLDAAMQVAIPEFDGRIIGVPVSFKEELEGASPVGTPVLHYAPDVERCARLAGLAVNHARLRARPPAETKLVVMLSSFPTKNARIGNAVGLDTPASAIALLERLSAEGYRVEHDFADGDALIHALIEAGGHDQEFLTDAQLRDAHARLPVAEYVEWFDRLPASLRESVVEQWGPAPGEWFVDDDHVVVSGLALGNVFVAIQPPRGFGENPVAIYHDPELAPAHHYLASYLWLRQSFGADAIVHLGKHGTLEWLPGKSLGLGPACAPDAALGSTPLFYPFVVDDPGEGVQAKRRAHAVIVDHLVPPMMRAETYDELAQLEQLLDEYGRCEALDPSKLPTLASRIWTLLHEAELHRDLDIHETEQPSLDDFGDLIEHVDGYLCEIKDLQVRDGLHVLGQVPSGDQFDGLLASILRLRLRPAVGAVLGLDPEEPTNLDRLHEVQVELVSALRDEGYDPAAALEVCERVLGRRDEEVEATLRAAALEIVPALRQTTDELDNLLGGLQGHHVPAGASGAPTRGRADVLPTGRNFYSVDPKAVPSELAYDVGVRLGDALLKRELDDRGAYPETVGIVVWGTAAMRTHGDDAGEILSLLGVRPVWHRETRRITGLSAIPLSELGRPRIDVAVRISGFFRDAFPGLVTLLDDAVSLVAALDEPVEQNYVRKHALADRDALVDELGADAAWRRATARIFGAKPGAYGAGLVALLESGSWRDDADLAQVYEVWGGHAYGRGLDGVSARDTMRVHFGRIDVAVKNVDTREHDLLDSSDYFAEHGGMVAYVRSVSGRDPRAMIGDSADPSSVHARTLAEESRRVFRSRVANPRWIASMIRHGYKGAFELSATVDYLFGYDATTGVVEDWMYETLSEKYVLDDEVADFMRKSNPWALRAIAERLLEAAERGLWEAPRDETLGALREAYLAAEGELEEAS